MSRVPRILSNSSDLILNFPQTPADRSAQYAPFKVIPGIILVRAVLGTLGCAGF